MLTWIKDLVVAATLGALLAIFFGFFSDRWFVSEAFLLFFLCTSIFATRRYIKDQKVAQPIADVSNMFNPKASKAQKQRALKLLMDEAKEEEEALEEIEAQDPSSDNNADSEDEHEPSSEELLAQAKESAKTILNIFIRNKMLAKDAKLASKVKRFFEEYDVAEYGLDTNEFVQYMLPTASFQWDDELDEDEQALFYQQVLKAVSSEPLMFKVHAADYDEATNKIQLKLDVNEHTEVWDFTHYDRQPSENFLIHLTLLLKEKANTLLHWQLGGEWASATLIPDNVASELTAKTDFVLGEIL